MDMKVRELEEETDMRFREMSTTTGLMPGGSVLALPLFSGLTARNKKARDVAVNLSFYAAQLFLKETVWLSRLRV